MSLLLQEPERPAPEHFADVGLPSCLELYCLLINRQGDYGASFLLDEMLEGECQLLLREPAGQVHLAPAHQNTSYKLELRIQVILDGSGSDF